jgi:hypothetical protein
MDKKANAGWPELYFRQEFDHEIILPTFPT